MFFDEKCGVCRGKIPDGENFYKLVMVQYLSENNYDNRDILHVCYGCFTDIFLGGVRIRKGKDLGIDENAE